MLRQRSRPFSPPYRTHAAITAQQPGHETAIAQPGHPGRYGRDPAGFGARGGLDPRLPKSPTPPETHCPATPKPDRRASEPAQQHEVKASAETPSITARRRCRGPWPVSAGALPGAISSSPITSPARPVVQPPGLAHQARSLRADTYEISGLRRRSFSNSADQFADLSWSWDTRPGNRIAFVAVIPPVHHLKGRSPANTGGSDESTSRTDQSRDAVLRSHRWGFSRCAASHRA